MEKFQINEVGWKRPMMRSQINSLAFFLSVGLCLAGCAPNESASIPELIAEKSVHENCRIWVEADGVHSSYLRAGYAGSCPALSIADYAMHLEEMFIRHGVNKNNYPSVVVIYINSYRTDGVLNDELVKAVDSRGAGFSLKIEFCDGRGLDEWFTHFNKRNMVLQPVSDVIEKSFSDIEVSDFNGILPYAPQGHQSNKCYPDSFGTAAYWLQSSARKQYKQLRTPNSRP